MKPQARTATRAGKFAWLWLVGLVLVGRAQAESPTGYLAAGSSAATPFYVRESGAAGPTVFVVAGIHGNEPAGSYAAEQIRRWPIARGKLVVVPRANVRALEAGTRLTPGATNAANLNRAFPPGRPDSGEPADPLASALWSFLLKLKPDWLLDLHEGARFRAQTTNSVGNSVIVSSSPAALQTAQIILNALNETVTTTNQRFVLLRQPIRGSLVRAAADHLGVRSFILETTLQSGSLAQRARQHRVAVLALLRHLEMVDAALTPETFFPPRSDSDSVTVAVYDGPGNGGPGVSRIVKQLGDADGFTAVRVCSEDISRGALDGFDVVIFPGGSGSGQARALGTAGRDAVRKFVERGGGYLGICAGAYLACQGFDWGLGIIDAKTLSPLWQRGRATIKMELTEAGRRIFGEKLGLLDCLYVNGPIVGPAGVETLPDFETLGYFRTEISKTNAHKGIMVDSPALFAGRFGRGRVLCFSPHPEQTDGLEDFVPRAARWLARRKVEGDPR